MLNPVELGKPGTVGVTVALIVTTHGCTTQGHGCRCRVQLKKETTKSSTPAKRAKENEKWESGIAECRVLFSRTLFELTMSVQITIPSRFS